MMKVNHKVKEMGTCKAKSLSEITNPTLIRISYQNLTNVRVVTKVLVHSQP